jgi:flavodoxin
MPDWSKVAIMNILVVYKSYHHMNTEKVARFIAEATNAMLIEADEVRPGTHVCREAFNGDSPFCDVKPGKIPDW